MNGYAEGLETAGGLLREIFLSDSKLQAAKKIIPPVVAMRRCFKKKLETSRVDLCGTVSTGSTATGNRVSAGFKLTKLN